MSPRRAQTGSAQNSGTAPFTTQTEHCIYMQATATGEPGRACATAGGPLLSRVRGSVGRSRARRGSVRLRPIGSRARFSAYMLASAEAITSAGVVVPSNSAAPIEAVSSIAPTVGIETGTRNERRRASASLVAVSNVAGSESNTANSSPPSRATVSAANTVGHSACERAQHIVSACMPVVVVDQLEVVEIEQQKSPAALVRAQRRIAELSSASNRGAVSNARLGDPDGPAGSAQAGPCAPPRSANTPTTPGQDRD